MLFVNGVTPCWTADEEYDEFEGNVVLPQNLVNSVVCTSGPDEPVSSVKPWWTGAEECVVCEGEVALPRTGSGESVNGVARTSGLDDPVGSCVEDGQIYENDVALHRTRSDQTFNKVVSIVCPGGPGNESGSVADASRDVIVMSSECREIDKALLRDIGQNTYVGNRPPVGAESALRTIPGAAAFCRLTQMGLGTGWNLFDGWSPMGMYPGCVSGFRADLVNRLMPLCMCDSDDVSSLFVSLGLFDRALSHPALSYMGILVVAGVRFDYLR